MTQKQAQATQTICSICQAVHPFAPETLKKLKLHCSRCKLPLSQQAHKRFAHMDSAVYKHPYDLESMEALKKQPGVEQLIEKMKPLSKQNYAEAFFAANGLRVNESQYPALHAKLQAACRILGFAKTPNLYLSFESLYGNEFSFSGGDTQPFIVLSPTIFKTFNDKDILALIGRELGHIHCHHMPLKATVDNLYVVLHKAFKKNTLSNLAESISLPIQQALFTWRIKANLSADRTAMLVVQEEKAIFSLLMKLAGGIEPEANLEAFVKQANQLNTQRVDEWLQDYWQQFSYQKRVSAFATWRAAELIAWSRSDRKKGYGYQDIVKIFSA